MNKKAVIAVVVVAVMVIAASAVLFMDGGDDKSNTVMTDFAGQEVVPVNNLDDGIIAVGQDSFRWVTYFGLADKCIMVDQNDMSNFLGKSFMYYGRALVDIEGSATVSPGEEARVYFTHTNCGITDDDVATIIDLKPSILVVPEGFYTDYKNQMKAIENSGINTVAIGYIYTFLEKDTFELTDSLVKQIDILSTALGMEERGKELNAAFNDTVSDIRSYASKVTEKRTGYIGGAAYNGAHDVSSSLEYYIPMELANVTNIIAGTANYDGSGVKEYSAQRIASGLEDDTILFLDASGYSMNGTANAAGILKMFSGHDAYLIAPYIWTGVNYDSVFVDALQILRYAYGDDVITEDQLSAEIDKVYERFYGSADSTRNIDYLNNKDVPLPSEGTSIFEDMNAVYSIVKGNPIYGMVTIDSEGRMTVA